jgi:hypothetical protein
MTSRAFSVVSLCRLLWAQAADDAGQRGLARVARGSGEGSPDRPRQILGLRRLAPERLGALHAHHH